jgi:hypothetical protein
LSRVEIATQPFGIVEDENRLRPGLAVTFQFRDGTPAVVYDSRTGTGVIDPVVTNDNGEVPGFLEQGSYTISVGGVTHDVEAVIGSVPQSSTAFEPATSACVTTASTLIVPSNPSRLELFVTLIDTANYVDLALSGSATAGGGIRLQPFAAPFRVQSYTGPVSAIAAAASVYVAIAEV